MPSLKSKPVLLDTSAVKLKQIFDTKINTATIATTINVVLRNIIRDEAM